MIACDFPAADLQLMLAAHAAYNVAHTKGDVPSEHRLPILRNPDDMHLEAPRRRSSCVIPTGSVARAQVTRTVASPEGEGFHHPRSRHYTKYVRTPAACSCRARRHRGRLGRCRSRARGSRSTNRSTIGRRGTRCVMQKDATSISKRVRVLNWRCYATCTCADCS